MGRDRWEVLEGGRNVIRIQFQNNNKGIVGKCRFSRSTQDDRITRSVQEPLDPLSSNYVLHILLNTSLFFYLNGVGWSLMLSSSKIKLLSSKETKVNYLPHYKVSYL